MYDFTVQKEMMIAANYLLKKHGLLDVSALGGAYNGVSGHPCRFSSDSLIRDIFCSDILA